MTVKELIIELLEMDMNREVVKVKNAHFHEATTVGIPQFCWYNKLTNTFSFDKEKPHSNSNSFKKAIMI